MARGENENEKYVITKFLIRHPRAKVYKGRNYIHKISKLINNSNSTISRRIVVFFVVDPDKTIISTRDIAPQQDEIDLHRAKAYRLELMAERKFNKDKLNVRDIELCEH